MLHCPTDQKDSPGLICFSSCGTHIQASQRKLKTFGFKVCTCSADALCSVSLLSFSFAHDHQKPANLYVCTNQVNTDFCLTTCEGAGGWRNSTAATKGLQSVNVGVRLCTRRCAARTARGARLATSRRNTYTGHELLLSRRRSLMLPNLASLVHCSWQDLALHRHAIDKACTFHVFGPLTQPRPS